MGTCSPPPATEPPRIADETEAILGPGGPVARALDRYEERPAQVAMARAVAAAIEEGRVLLAEAGTGTGKSLAYLVPALLHARAHGSPVVVATRTKNLQEQLVRKDIPFLQRALPFPFTAALAVGRQNFVSLRRLAEAEMEPSMLDADERLAIGRLGAAARTGKGNRGDLGFEVAPSAWERVQSENDNCLGNQCIAFSQCFYFRMRRALREADLVVANHHLVLADLVVKGDAGPDAGVLPPYRTLIIDEAHHLEETAAEFLGVRVSLAGVAKRLGRLRSKSGAKGLLPHLEACLPGLGKAGAEVAGRLAREVGPRLEAARTALDDLAGEAPSLVRRHVSGRGETGPGSTYAALRPGERERPPWPTLLPRMADLEARIEDLAASVEGAMKAASDLLGEMGERGQRLAGAVLETRAAAGRLHEVASGLDRVAADEERDLARWVEAGSPERREDVVFRAAPVDVGPILAERLFGPLDAAVLTSATLATGSRGFDYLEGRLGLDRLPEGRVTSACYPSPFDHERRACLGAAADGPEPGDSRFAAALADRVVEAVEITGGGTFVLFTAFGLLDDVFERVNLRLAALGLRVLRQGDAPRGALLDQFRSAGGRAVLLGADSFWEGVDVPGRDLRNVIVTRLPFRPPADPLAEARARAVEAAGGSAFRELSLPEAVLRFKQGIGRLIRTRTDTGILVVLDPRIAGKSYGKAFLDALPPMPRHVGPWTRVRAALAEAARRLEAAGA